MNIYNFISYKIFKNIKKFNNNLIIELDDLLDLNLIIKIISKFLLCNNIINVFCNKCINCNNINKNLHPNLIIIDNTNEKDKYNDIKYIINNKITDFFIYSKYKFIFIYNINLCSNNIIDFLLRKSAFIEYKFIFISNNIKKLNFFFKMNYDNLILDSYDYLFNFKILKKIFKSSYNNKSIITTLNLSNNSIIKSELLLRKCNWEKRLIFINLLKFNFLNKNLLFIINIVNFKETEICNPIFWLLTFISDSINYKNNLYIKNIDNIFIIKKIINTFSLKILNIIQNKIIEYFYIINKNININKSLILIRNLIYIENIIK